MQSEWKSRLRYWTHTLTQDFYIPLGKITFKGFQTFRQLSFQEAMAESFEPMPVETEWGEEWQYTWLKSEIVLPPDAEGKMVVLDLQPGGESTLFIDGAEFGTKRAEWVTVPHHYIQDNFICEKGKPGQVYQLVVEAYAGHFFPESKFGGVSVGPVLPGSYTDPMAGRKRARIGDSTFGIWNEDAYQLWLDAVTLIDVMDNMPEGSLRAAKIEKALKKFTLEVDFEQPLESRLKDYAKGREILKPLLDAVNGTTAPTFYAIGNSHLDVVWLWPYEETVRKVARTFAQQLRLIEKYPGYRYLQSQPQTYLMCKEHYPQLYERIKAAVKSGGWIAEGGMWVEPDTNMSSGESLIRQLIHGLRFFKEEFGVDCEILWLPDTFGYSAILPQILNSFGIKYLVTQKIFWSYNDGDQFPYHYFVWQGNDGSEIVSFLPTSYTYKTTPAELMKTWKDRVLKDEMDKFLLPYGYGDGGGGPSRDYIELAQRQKNLEGVPKVKMVHPAELFKDLENDGGPQHKYTGELYFSAHRGVYTSQAGVKKGNRKSELSLREAELWCSIAGVVSSLPYPVTELDMAWKKVLLNQFHDILPGSSIARVYKESAIHHNKVIATSNELATKAMEVISRGNTGISIFNSLSWERSVIIELPESFTFGAKTAEGAPVETSAFNGKLMAKVHLPSCGYTSIVPSDDAAPVTNAVQVIMSNGGAVLENSKIKASINRNGELVSFIMNKREFAAAPMNSFRLYKDVPRVFDAWDIDSMYEEQPVLLDPLARIELIMDSPLRAVIKIEKTIGNSILSQQISLDSDSSRIEFETTIDWRELHRLLKVSFPLDIHTDEAINEIQFGYIKRPTHRSRKYDKDRFEVCNHKYTALCDESHGAAVLNDCKYGVSMLDNAINLTLLKAAGSPEMRADNGIHSFTYAFTAWDAAFAESAVVREGYELNVPARISEGDGLSKSFFNVSNPNIIVDTIKQAEDGSGDLIIRLYESMHGAVSAVLSMSIPFKKAYLCNMNENITSETDIQNGDIALDFKPFGIMTLRLSSN